MPNQSSNKGFIPKRMCVICRSKKNKSELKKFVIINKEIVFDENKMQRGYYVCKEEDCMLKLPRWFKKKFKKK